MGRAKKKPSSACHCKPTNHIHLLLSKFSPFFSTLPSILSFLPYFSIDLSLFISFILNLAHSLYLSVSVASRHRAGVLTCASNTWASLLIRLRSVLREIPSTYTHTHTYTLARTHTNTPHAHTQTGRLQSPRGLVLVNYSVCVGGSVWTCTCVSALINVCAFGCVHVSWISGLRVCQWEYEMVFSSWAAAVCL